MAKKRWQIQEEGSDFGTGPMVSKGARAYNGDMNKQKITL